MADGLFRKLFDDTNFCSPARSTPKFQEVSGCDSPMMEYLRTRKRLGPNRDRKRALIQRNFGSRDFSDQKSVATKSQPIDLEIRYSIHSASPSVDCFATVQGELTLEPQAKDILEDTEANSSPLSPRSVFSLPDLSLEGLTNKHDVPNSKDCKISHRPSQDEPFKIKNPISTNLINRLRSLQIHTEPPSYTCRKTSNASSVQKCKRVTCLSVRPNQQQESLLVRKQVCCVTTSESNAKETLDRVSENPSLISDGSKAYTLPTIPGRHQDLKSITPETLVKLINYEYNHVIENFMVVDCRYPYEHDGGHIKDAKHYYTRDNIVENLLNTETLSKLNRKPTVLIFHCEFSSERAPKLLRFLRNQDRLYNKDHYPKLCYPEVYLLYGGYKLFYENYKDLCTPRAYVPMCHSDHQEDLRKFRAKTKIWSGDKKRKPSLISRIML